MLDGYQMDPALNKNLVFAYQPPPEIDPAMLPTLAENWLDDLQKIACATNNKLPNNCFAKHLGETSNYRAKIPLLEQLQLIYHRLLGNLDAELGELSADHRHGLVYKLTEEIKECTEGFHNRVNIIVDSFHKPRNLSELLYIVRNRAVQEIAMQLTNEVHAWNRVSIIAAEDGLGIKANFSDDTYSGNLSTQAIRQALQQTFAEYFTPYFLPNLLIAAFKELIPELEIEKESENGICLQTQEKIIGLIKDFLPKYINEKPKNAKDPNSWKNYFVIQSNEKKSFIFKFIDINYGKMYQSFYYTLLNEKYFNEPEINTLLENAYFNLFIENKSNFSPAPVISRLFRENQYYNLLTQLVELNKKFPIFYRKITKNKEFIKNILVFNNFLMQQLKISEHYSEKIILGFKLIFNLDLNLSRDKIKIIQIAESLLVSNKVNLNLLMLGTLNNLELVKDIFAFLEKYESVIGSKITEQMLLMKNSDHCNALMIAAHKRAEAIRTILGFLASHVGRFANDTLRKLFTQQQIKGSDTAVTLTARNHPDMLNNVLAFITENMSIEGEIFHTVLFPEHATGTCNALTLALKNQADTTFSILKFISKNIRNFDSKALRKMFLEKDENGFTILMLTVRYHPNALPILLKLFEHKVFFSTKYLTALFLEKNLLNYNFLMLAAEYQPKSVPIILQFIHNKQKIFNFSLEEILLNKNKKGCNSLMLSRHHPETMTSIIDFIYQQPKGVFSRSLEEIFLLENNSGLNFFMLLAKDKPPSLKRILEFIEKHPNLFTKENLQTLISKKSEQEYNSFMLAARNQYDAVNYILNFIQKNPKIFSSVFLNELILAHDQNRCNALMIAATHRPKVVELLLIFLADNIAPGPISIDTIKEFIFKKIHDKQASFSIFFGGRYDYYKSVLSVISQLKDQTPVNALLKFIDEHIESFGIQVLIDLLKEQDAQDNYIFRSTCARNSFLMKNTLNFLANSINNEDLMPMQNLVAYFIFEQFACWSIKTVADQELLDKIIINCSVPLLIYFDKDYFAEKPNNLKIVTDKLFRCYLNELEDRKIKKITYTTNFSFLKWRYSAAQKLEAAQELEKVLDTKDFVAGVNLFQLKPKYPALTGARLGNLFAAYQEIDLLEAKSVVESDLENTAICSGMRAVA